MVTTMQQCERIQNNRIKNGQFGVARAVRRFLMKQAIGGRTAKMLRNGLRDTTIDEHQEYLRLKSQLPVYLPSEDELEELAHEH